MGSFSRGESINFFTQLYGNKLESYFGPLLVGKKIEQLLNVEVSRYVKGDVIIDGETYPIHYRWSSEEEGYEGIELEEDYTKLEDYYKNCIHQKNIVKITVGAQDRDDEVYLACLIGERYDIQIPLGFDPENHVFYGFSEEILSEAEMETYSILRKLEWIVYEWNKNPSTDIETQSTYIGAAAQCVFSDQSKFEPKYGVSDFDKMSSIWSLFEQERVDSLTLLNEIKNTLNK